MAGGKVSPRQKMINMMYLVLTALLALNVSAEILKSFDLIAQSLASAASKIDTKNEQVAASIKDAVDEELKQGNAKNKDLVKSVDNIRNETAKVINYIEARKKDMFSAEIGNTDPATGKLLKPDDTEKNYRYWMIEKDGKAGADTDNEKRGAGWARDLRKTLNGYSEFASKVYFDNALKDEQATLKKSGVAKFAPIALDPKDDPKALKDDHLYTWEYNIFHGVPVAANIAMLEKFKNDVKVIESDLLESLRRRLNAVDFKIDSLVAMDAPLSQVVAAGMPFETQLFVTASSKQTKPKFLPGAGTLKLSADGNTATLRINASGAVIPRGQTEGDQSYSAVIEVPKADGTTQRLTINKKFKVRKPEVQVTSAAIQIMYKLCGNDIKVDVPALGDLYNPVITASEGQVIKSTTSRIAFRVVPKGNTTVLDVKTNTNGQVIDIDKITYKVIPPPKPTIYYFEGGRQLDPTAPIKMGANIEVRVRPEPNFLNSLRNDARYQLVGVVLKAGTGLSAPQAVGQPITSEKIMKGEYATATIRVPRDLQPGNKIFVQIDKINRINFSGDAVEEPFTARELAFSSVVKN